MSLDTRYLTNGKKTLYIAIDSSNNPPTRYVGANKEDIPESIRDHLPKLVLSSGGTDWTGSCADCQTHP